MTGYKRVNYYELCRLCTSSQPKDKIHIFRDEGRKMQLQQKIQSCFPLLVCEHDYLPKVVCTTCIEALDQCYLFRQNCINSETMLSSYFSNFRFTDDFKKAGKVYVKDTGQHKIENNGQTPTVKKSAQENLTANMTILQDGTQQYINFDLQNLQTKIPSYTTTQKLLTTNSVNMKLQNADFLTLNNASTPAQTTQNIQTSPQKLSTAADQQQQLKFNIKQSPNNDHLSSTTNNNNNNTVCNQTLQQQAVTCNATSPNLTSLSNNLTTFAPFNNQTNITFNKSAINSLEQQQQQATTDFNAVKTTNLVQSHALMYIDIEQLVESGLPEQEINKLKEVLLKPIDYNKNPLNNNKIILNHSADHQTNIELSKLNNMATENDDVSATVLSSINNNNNNHTSSNLAVKDDASAATCDTVKTFKCETCDKVFKRREHLYQHAKLHSGVRPFNCVNCPKTFSRKEHLIRHLTSHSGVKDYPCDICNKKFSRPDNLKKHKKTHQKSGPFVCEVCAKSFVIKHYYLAHKLQHHETVPAGGGAGNLATTNTDKITDTDLLK